MTESRLRSPLTRLLTITTLCFSLSACDSSFVQLKSSNAAKTGTEASEEAAAREKQKDPIAYAAKQAKIAEEQGDYIAAAAFWGTLRESSPDNVEYIVGHGRTARKAGLLDKSMEVLSEAQAKMPQDGLLNAELGYTLLATGNAAGAVSAFGTALSQNPRDIKLMSAQGVAYDRTGRYDEAGRVYDMALSIEPKNTVVLNNYALSRMAAGDIKKAQQLASRALEQPDLTPNLRGGLVRLLSAPAISNLNPQSGGDVKAASGSGAGSAKGYQPSVPVGKSGSAASITEGSSSSNAVPDSTRVIELQAEQHADEVVNGVNTLLSQPKRWGN